MATVIVLDKDGNERMHRNSHEFMLPTPPNFTDNEWTAAIVKNLLDSLDKEETNEASQTDLHG